ncbi:MAG: DNA repair protein RadA [Deltaproteobacteria bacterium]|nr:MAG: DNA repair protein RadA [Deltaproteobacteria bacterium]
MGRSRSVFACTECGAQQPRWLGRCPECGGWSTLVEERAATAAEPRELLAREPSGAKPRRLAEIDADAVPRLDTGIAELDRVLGGGLVPGSVVLLAGEPGVGKSTLALQLAAGIASFAQRAEGERRPSGGSRPALYVAGEESPEQIRLRANRLPSLPEALVVLAETCVEAIAEPWRELQPSLVLVDSVQTLRSERVESAPGSVAQVRECAALLAATAKAHGAALVLVGHVTKEGAIAGPRVLEHLVDVVLALEGDGFHAFRLLRAHKNRFGSTQEIGVFHMGGAGLEAVANPSELFLAERRAGAPGSCIVPWLEGSRPMLVEIQALVAPAGYGTARRTAIGVDDARLALLLAVLDRRARVDLLSRDVYVNAVGGVRIREPGADLALALALASSRLDLALPADAAACGEVGLGGEIRRVARLDARVAEAVRLGFRRVLVPAGAQDSLPAPRGARLVPVGDLAEAVAWLSSTAVHGAEADR